MQGAVNVYRSVFPGEAEDEIAEFRQQFAHVMHWMEGIEGSVHELLPWFRRDFSAWPRVQQLIQYSLTLCPGSCSIERVFSRMNLPVNRNLCAFELLESQVIINHLMVGMQNAQPYRLKGDFVERVIAEVLDSWLSERPRRTTLAGGKKRKPVTDALARLDEEMAKKAAVSGRLLLASSSEDEESEDQSSEHEEDEAKEKEDNTRLVEWVLARNRQYPDVQSKPGRPCDLAFDGRKKGFAVTARQV